MDETPRVSLAPPCGLYCGRCLDYVNGVCHGCGCTCGSCAGQWHDEHCAIAQCARSAALLSCAECVDLPCSSIASAFLLLPPLLRASGTESGLKRVCDHALLRSPSGLSQPLVRIRQLDASQY
jgi:hypothetical protein